MCYIYMCQVSHSSEQNVNTVLFTPLFPYILLNYGGAIFFSGNFWYKEKYNKNYAKLAIFIKKFVTVY